MHLLISLAFMFAQMTMLQEVPVVHLGPHSDAVQIGFGGKLLELINAPAIVRLPKIPPKLDDEGKPWVVRIKNSRAAWLEGSRHWAVGRKRVESIDRSGGELRVASDPMYDFPRAKRRNRRTIVGGRNKSDKTGS
jgi:hypothetical protein